MVGHVGIGLTLGQRGDLPLLEASVPEVGFDATRVEVLDPPLTALLPTGRLDTCLVDLHGDCASVVSLVNRSHGPLDSFEFSCAALT